MNLDKEQQNFLQKSLSGMTGGFTLFADRLYVRNGDFTFSFVLTGVEDHTEQFCSYCNDEIIGEPKYHVTITHDHPTMPSYTFEKPLCYDCAVPK